MKPSKAAMQAAEEIARKTDAASEAGCGPRFMFAEYIHDVARDIDKAIKPLVDAAEVAYDHVKSAHHQPHCAISHEDGAKCDCGLHDSMKALRTALANFKQEDK